MYHPSKTADLFNATLFSSLAGRQAREIFELSVTFFFSFMIAISLAAISVSKLLCFMILSTKKRFEMLTFFCKLFTPAIMARLFGSESTTQCAALHA